MPFPNGSRVEIRSRADLPWRAGEVISQDDVCYDVQLDAALTADEWSGSVRRYGGTEPIGNVMVYKAVEILPPDKAQIRPEGG